MVIKIYRKSFWFINQ